MIQDKHGPYEWCTKKELAHVIDVRAKAQKSMHSVQSL